MSFDTYIKIEGVEGEASAKGVEKQIEIYSFSWGASNPVSVASSGGKGLSAGRVSISSFNLMKKLDKASTALFQACATGKNFTKATVIMRKAGGDAGQSPFLQYDFTTLMVESIQWSGSSGGDDTPTESVSLAFAKVEITYNTVDAKGSPTKAGQAAWDLSTVSAK
ncbi:MAG TPA: type VI secretion system tube protein Hcp [Gemmatimonadaceae bacterium]|jgi:type VI secretion system secreted protein Hcp